MLGVFNKMIKVKTMLKNNDGACCSQQEEFW